MRNTILYSLTALIWSSTWLAIHYQIGSVPVYWSVCYRFLTAGLLLFLFCVYTKKTLKFSWMMHLLFVLQAALLFSLNYIFAYFAISYLVSGIVAILSATTVIFNILNARLFFKTPITLYSVLGALCGFIGLCILFLPEFLNARSSALASQVGLGVILTLIGCLIASLGNMMAKYLQHREVPIVISNAYCMTYGGLISALVAFYLTGAPVVEFTFSYLGALFYLSLFGSIIAFGAYLELLGSIGPEKVAYIFVITPVLAMVLSSFFEDFHWTTATYFAIVFIVIGNLLIQKKNPAKLVEKEAVLNK